MNWFTISEVLPISSV